MLRHAFKLREQHSGRPRRDRRGQRFSSGHCIAAVPVDDATVFESWLAGKWLAQISAEVGLSASSVRDRFECLGIPTRPCRFLYGEPFCKKHLNDLCRDFGVSRKAVCQASGLIYSSVSNRFAQFKPDHLLSTKVADRVLATRKDWIQRFCIQPVAGKPVRQFLASELRDLPSRKAELIIALNELRIWLRGVERLPASHAVLDWICDSVRKEVAQERLFQISRRAHRTLLFLRPELRTLMAERTGLLPGRRAIGEVADQLLAREYGAVPNRIRLAARGELTSLVPRTLEGQIRGDKPPSRIRKRGRQPSRDTDPRITIIADCKLRGINDYRIAPYAYPLHHDKAARWKTTSSFLRRHSGAIRERQAYLSRLSVPKRQAEVDRARRTLSQTQKD